MNENLPNEIIFDILLRLPYNDVINYCLTSNTALQICRTSDFWTAKARRDLGIDLGLFGLSAPARIRNGRELYLYAVNKYLVQVSAEGDINEVSRILSLATYDRNSLNLSLQAAACGRNIEVLKLLTGTGAIISYSALRNAISCEWFEGLRYLLDRYEGYRALIDRLISDAEAIYSSRDETTTEMEQILNYLELKSFEFI